MARESKARLRPQPSKHVEGRMRPGVGAHFDEQRREHRPGESVQMSKKELAAFGDKIQPLRHTRSTSFANRGGKR